MCTVLMGNSSQVLIKKKGEKSDLLGNCLLIYMFSQLGKVSGVLNVVYTVYLSFRIDRFIINSTCICRH